MTSKKDFSVSLLFCRFFSIVSRLVSFLNFLLLSAGAMVAHPQSRSRIVLCKDEERLNAQSGRMFIYAIQYIAHPNSYARTMNLFLNVVSSSERSLED